MEGALAPWICEQRSAGLLPPYMNMQQRQENWQQLQYTWLTQVVVTMCTKKIPMTGAGE